MKYVEIEKRYSEKVAEYLANGYHINVRSMSGTQGEDCKVDLAKGDEIVRIWVERDHDWNDPDNFYGDKVLIRVGILDAERAKEAKRYRDLTLWFKDFSIVYEEVFYRIDDHGDWYLDNKADVLEYLKIHRSRRKSGSYGSYVYVDATNEQTKEIAARYLKRVVGYKRLNWNLIKVDKATDQNIYVVVYNGNRYRLK